MQLDVRRRLRQADKLFRILRQPSYWRGLRRGVAAAVEHDDIPYGAEFRTIVDVGANRGQFALVAMHRFPVAQLCCFEPLPAARQKLHRVVASHPQVTIFDIALAAGAGASEMHITRNDDSSSLLRPAHQGHSFSGTEEVDSISVKTARLDEILDITQIVGPALLKIDVQGTEFEVLLGARNLIDSFDIILVECSFTELYVGQRLACDVITLMGQHGWHVQGVYDVVCAASGNCLQADLLFEPVSRGRGM